MTKESKTPETKKAIGGDKPRPSRILSEPINTIVPTNVDFPGAGVIEFGCELSFSSMRIH
jgi:hypothetical protein